MNNQQLKRLMELMEKYPQIEARLHALVDLVENDSGEFDRADDAEGQLIIEMRKLGKDILQSWADNASQKKTQAIIEAYAADKHSKKNFIG